MKNRFSKYLRLGMFAGFLAASSVFAEVHLPNVFSDHMVLQRGKPIQVWGWASPNEKISIRLGEDSVQVVADKAGQWRAALPQRAAGGPLELIVKGENEVRFTDVMVGEVWLCSGQSNMDMGMKFVEDGEAEIAAANDSNLRLLMVPNRWSPLEQTNIDAAWKRCSPETLAESGWGGFSACAYFFGKKLRQELGVPIGLIDATWGGTDIQSWTPPEGYAQVPALKSEYQKVLLADPHTPEHQRELSAFLDKTGAWLSDARAALDRQAIAPAMPSFPNDLLPPHDLQQATALFNGMIHPLCPFTIAGTIWYQGENNRREGMRYFERMKALIGGWREIWNEGEFPFLFVQIAPYDYNEPRHILPEFWEAQSASLSIPNSGMAVINDIGNLRDIHPKDKRDVGERLARIALAKTYGRENLEYSGPVFKSLKREGNQLRVTFEHADGLRSRDGKPLNWFEIIDADRGGFVKADAQIDGNSIVLSAAEAPNPVAMRFAWSMLAEPNLANAAGLPASAFRAGTVPERDMLEMNVPEAKDYQLVYDLNLAKAGKKIAYDQDRSSEMDRPFDRVAYFLELWNSNDEPHYVYVSMNAFTSDLKKIAVPTVESGALFQQNVKAMNVFSNAKGVTTGTNLSGGNIEFWPSNYAPENRANVPGASSSAFDFGDSGGDSNAGYGSMQVHNHAKQQTIFAFNHWSEGDKADVGIGNNPSGNPDWTFKENAKEYSLRRLRVLVHYRD
ncbi:MAG TPA: sialate O-acetylesterase [Verrucomicrobiae bacterium]|nr:sialate O-acetylesterase [Verrucomicrobiae bacterium]